MSPLPSLSDVLLRTQTDERLARLVANGDQAAFALLVQRHRTPLLRSAARVVGPSRSEDVVQQALLRAWVSMADGKEVRNVRAWLYQILRHAAYTEHARGAGSTHPIPDELADRDPSEAVEQRLIVRELVHCISDLPDHQRTALVETELGGRSRRQIASDLGVSEGAVRQLVHRARTALRLAMTAVTPYPLVAWASRHSGGSRLAGLSSIAEDAAGRSGALVEPAASGAAAGGALAVKGGVALLAAGAIGGLGWQSLAGHAGHAGHHRRHAAAAPLTADRRGEGGAADGMRTAAAAGNSPVGSSSPARALLMPAATLSRAVAPAQPGSVHVGRTGTQSFGISQASLRQPSQPEDRGQSGPSGAGLGRSDGGMSSSDGGMSRVDGGDSSGRSSQPASGSATPGSDGEAGASPTAPNSSASTAPNTSASTTSSDGGSREASRTAPTTRVQSGGD